MRTETGEASVGPVDAAPPYDSAYQEWWAARGYDPTFGRKLPALFERLWARELRR